jgi:hypothetical protein
LSQDGGPHVHGRRRHARSRAEDDILEHAAVLAESNLGVGAAVDVIKDDARQAPPGLPAQVGDVDYWRDKGP